MSILINYETNHKLMILHAVSISGKYNIEINSLIIYIARKQKMPVSLKEK